ncbi:PepSY-associated TM helix domain-containing protein [Neobacillus cucumis]|uniref:PepSY domain-containing protein n=1 Tax=Neobacillus cucumis TaxID=1740721 RepID=A0A2N5HJ71_9BACI|nr:PepSY-associated TM helix domain-containing protein [Neobacillus cucumis]PLS05554.1 hypothetical protein CVD27_09285 [Neobacillus cucumis]
MKQTRKAHLWIGLICSIFILMESITGLLMNEPWLIGQSQTEQRGNFQQGMMPGQQQGTNTSSNQTTNQTQGSNQLANGQTKAQTGSSTQSSGNTNGQTGSNTQSNSNGQLQGPGGQNGMNFGEKGAQSGSLMGIIKGLHEGRIGTTNIKWLIDLTAIAMIFLTGSGIYLSSKVLVLAAERKRKKLKMEREIA